MISTKKKAVEFSLLVTGFKCCSFIKIHTVLVLVKINPFPVCDVVLFAAPIEPRSEVRLFFFVFYKSLKISSDRIVLRFL